MAKKQIKIDSLNDTLSNMFSDSDLLSNTTDSSSSSNNRRRRKPSRPHFDEEAVIESNKSNIVQLKVSSLCTHRHHIFAVRDDAEMTELVESIKEIGILNPIIVRKIEDSDEYELISGHRRKHAAETIGLNEVPCIILDDIDDYTADVYMIEANRQRVVRPSEKAKAYKLKYEAQKQRIQNQKENLEGAELNDDDEYDLELEFLGDTQDEHGERQIRRYIRLADLNEELLNMIDEDKIGVTAGHTLTYLSDEDQQIVVDAISIAESESGKEVAVSSKNAENIKKIAKTSSLTVDKVVEVLNGTRRGRSANKEKKPKLNEKTIKEYLPEYISSASTESKIEFTRHALTYFAKYVEEHPEEFDKNKLFHLE